MEGGCLGLLLGSKGQRSRSLLLYIDLFVTFSLLCRFRAISFVSFDLQYSNFIYRLLMEGGCLGLILGSYILGYKTGVQTLYFQNL
jgi:hypothetical protein